MNTIKLLMKRKGVTINTLAEKLGVSRQALSRQINGKMLVETAQRIADALDVPLWQLFASPEDIAAFQDNSVYCCPHCGGKIGITIKKQA